MKKLITEIFQQAGAKPDAQPAHEHRLLMLLVQHYCLKHFDEKAGKFPKLLHKGEQEATISNTVGNSASTTTGSTTSRTCTSSTTAVSINQILPKKTMTT
eukprot:3058118-Amphidinium_carterae.1